MKTVIAWSPGGPEVLELIDFEPPTTQVGEVEIRVLLRDNESNDWKIGPDIFSTALPPGSRP